MLPEWQDGDWRGLWRDYGPKLMLFARQQAGAVSEAEDLVQEAFIRYWKARRKDADLAPTLLFTLVKRIAIEHARRWKGRPRPQDDRLGAVEPSPPMFEDVLGERERKELLEAALKTLPDAQREVLVLKIWGELTFEEIGQTLEISPFTAASRYRYGLGHLREILTPSLS